MCYQMKSPFLPRVVSRMTRITLEYGVHETSSAFALSMYALVYLTVFGDISEGKCTDSNHSLLVTCLPQDLMLFPLSLGYRLGKYSLALSLNNPNPMPDVYCVIYGMINIWKASTLEEHLIDCIPFYLLLTFITPLFAEGTFASYLTSAH